jgi:acetylornithine deacetylase
MFRTVSGHEEVRAALGACTAGRVIAEDVLVVPPVRLTTVSGFDTAVFSFTTDIPFLDAWGAPLLLGPGSVALAHTADEYVSIAELHEAVELYAGLATRLLGS